jgi:MEMO1 family protein
VLAHRKEHSLEVQLPFLQRVLGDFDVLPLVVGSARPEEVAEVLEALWTQDVLPIISSDLSHYLPYDVARRVDRETADHILQLDGPLEEERACGAAAINGLLLVARRRGLSAELLDLRSSGDTAGDKSEVVGYGAFAFHPRA